MMLFMDCNFFLLNKLECFTNEQKCVEHVKVSLPQ
jgi:hypothetical protein